MLQSMNFQLCVLVTWPLCRLIVGVVPFSATTENGTSADWGELMQVLAAQHLQEQESLTMSLCQQVGQSQRTLCLREECHGLESHEAAVRASIHCQQQKQEQLLRERNTFETWRRATASISTPAPNVQESQDAFLEEVRQLDYLIHDLQRESAGLWVEERRSDLEVRCLEKGLALLHAKLDRCEEQLKSYRGQTHDFGSWLSLAKLKAVFP